MNITVSKKKQEMREDPLVNGLVQLRAWINAHTNVILGVVVALAFVGLIFGGYYWIQNRGISSAQEAFGKAVTAYTSQDEAKAIELFTIVADNHKNTPHAAYSAYMLGTVFLGQSKYDEAIQWLKSAQSRKSGTGMVHGAAAEALSAAFEGKGDLKQACTYAEEALKDPAIAYRHPGLRWKLALINKQLDRTKESATYCRQIIADTLAMEYRQKAENLSAELLLLGKS